MRRYTIPLAVAVLAGSVYGGKRLLEERTLSAFNSALGGPVIECIDDSLSFTQASHDYLRNSRLLYVVDQLEKAKQELKGDTPTQEQVETSLVHAAGIPQSQAVRNLILGAIMGLNSPNHDDKALAEELLELNSSLSPTAEPNVDDTAEGLENVITKLKTQIRNK